MKVIIKKVNNGYIVNSQSQDRDGLQGIMKGLFSQIQNMDQDPILVKAKEQAESDNLGEFVFKTMKQVHVFLDELDALEK